MPNNEVTEPITDQEIAVARLVHPDRQQILNRLWEIANLSPDLTRGSVTGQVKALSLIIAMENFIPDRRAVSAEKKSAPAPVNAQIYKSAWLREQRAAAVEPQPSPAPQQEEVQKAAVPSQPTVAPRVPLAENLPPYVPPVTSLPDTRVAFSIRKNPLVRPR
jgi:hypothetical protein